MKLPTLRKRLTFASVALVFAFAAGLSMEPGAADKFYEILKWLGGTYLLGQSFSDAAKNLKQP